MKWEELRRLMFSEDEIKENDRLALSALREGEAMKKPIRMEVVMK